MKSLMILTYLGLVFLAGANAAPTNPLVAKILIEGRIKFVQAVHPTERADQFVEDGDANTIELVELKSGEGFSRVSDDGQVVFLTREDMAHLDTPRWFNKVTEILLTREMAKSE